MAELVDAVPDQAVAPLLDYYISEELNSLFTFDEDGLRGNFRDTKAAIYGGDDKEVVKELHAYRQFPGSYDVLKQASHPYSLKPIKFKSLKEKMFMYKQDIIAEVFISMPTSPLGPEANDLIKGCTELFLRAHESRLDGICEVVHFDEKELNDFREALAAKTEKMSLDAHLQTLTSPTSKELFEKLKAMIPVHPNDIKCFNLKNILEIFEAKKPIENNMELYLNVLDWLTIIFGELEKFIETHPEWFLPKCLIETLTLISAVRLFEDGCDRFCLAHEVMAVMNEQNLRADNFRAILKNSDELSSIGYERLRLEIHGLMEVLDFVPIPVLRSKQRVCYIPSFKAKYCMPRYDLFMEFIRYVVSVKSIFQNMDDTNFVDFYPMFHNIPDTCDSYNKSPTFIDVRDARSLMSVFRIHIHTNFAHLMTNIKQVRPVGETGFTFDQFKAEIEYLGLKKFFPMTGDFDAPIYELINSKKAKDVLRTCDMYEALEMLQIWCLLIKMPDLYVYLQKQGYCYKYPVMCFACGIHPFCRKKKNT
uniref:RING-type domain-containing protein n=1 Tax=Caenorhabditis tropicalis TaxID=1561998 RepID=A0A1I7SYD3_9PELO